MAEDRQGHQVRIIGPGPASVIDDNIDVEVRFRDGRRYVATFFTLANLATLFRKNKLTGECCGGSYLWATDMVIVEELTEEVVERAVAGLLADGEFEGAFSLVT